jgi:hypothetical protein
VNSDPNLFVNLDSKLFMDRLANISGSDRNRIHNTGIKQQTVQWLNKATLDFRDGLAGDVSVVQKQSEKDRAEQNNQYSLIRTLASNSNISACHQ